MNSADAELIPDASTSLRARDIVVVAVGLAVTGGFAFMLSEFLEQTLVVRKRR